MWFPSYYECELRARWLAQLSRASESTKTGALTSRGRFGFYPGRNPADATGRPSAAIALAFYCDTLTLRSIATPTARLRHLQCSFSRPRRARAAAAHSAAARRGARRCRCAPRAAPAAHRARRARGGGRWRRRWTPRRRPGGRMRPRAGDAQLMRSAPARRRLRRRLRRRAHERDHLAGHGMGMSPFGYGYGYGISPRVPRPHARGDVLRGAAGGRAALAPSSSSARTRR